MLRSSVILAIVLMVGPSFGWAQDSQYRRPKANVPKSDAKLPSAANDEAKGSGATEAKSSDTDKLDISDLEDKYWSAKDTDYSVVQNRTYSKVKKLALSVTYGPIVNDLYSSGNNTSVAANYFWSERYGVELNYTQSDLENSDSTNAFLTTVGGFGDVAPDFGRVKSYYGVGFNWVPFYAKMSLLGSKIMYFDMMITPGLGITTYEQQTSPDQVGFSTTDQTAFTYTLDISQFYFISKHLAIRIDIKNRWFKEDILQYTTGEKLRDKTSHTIMFLGGLMVYF